MAGVEAKLDTRRLTASLDRLSRSTGRTALRRSLKRGVDSMRTQAVKEVRRDLNLKPGAIRKAMRISRAATTSALRVSLAPVPLSRFGARQTRKGVTFQVKRAGGRKVLPGSFKAKMRSGHVGVYRRRGKARLPIQELFSASAGSSLRDREILRRVQRKGTQAFRRELEGQIRLATRGSRR